MPKKVLEVVSALKKLYSRLACKRSSLQKFGDRCTTLNNSRYNIQ